KLLTSKDEDIRLYAVWGLAFVGPPAKQATPAVVKALSDPSIQVKRKAAFALGRIDADPAQAVPALVGALEDADESVRQAAAASLPGMGKTSVPALTKVFQTDKAALRNVAIKTLGHMAAAAPPAI